MEWRNAKRFHLIGWRTYAELMEDAHLDEMELACVVVVDSACGFPRTFAPYATAALIRCAM